MENKKTAQKKEESYNYIAFVCCLAAILIGILVLFSWTFSVRVLQKFINNFILMAPYTAIVFILISSILIIYLSRLTNKVKKYLLNSSLVVLWILLLVKTTQFIFVLNRTGYPLSRNPEKFKAFLTKPISLLTLAIFILISISVTSLIIFSKNKKVGDFAGATGFFIFILSITFLLSYLYGTPLLYGNKIMPVTLSAALAFLFLSFAVVIVAGQDSFPLRLFTGSSTRSLLLRSFLPVIFLMLLIHEIFFGIIENYIKINFALHTVIEVLLISFIAGAVIFQIAKVVGGRIDAATLGRMQAEYRINHLAFYDSLTDLPNRALFTYMLGDKLTEAKKSNKKIAVFFLNLDNFKKVKNTFGHDFADSLLVKISKQLETIIPGEDVLSKVGEDEYLLFLEVDDIKKDASLAEKILNLFKSPWLIDSQQISIVANIGVAVFPDNGKDVDTLVKNADLAMTSAKNDKPNSFKYFKKSMTKSREETYKKLILASKLSDAIKNKEFIVFYQPIISIKTGEISGAEALLRWQKPGNKIIMPKDFIPIAENTGQIVPIDNFVLETACKQNKRWQGKGFSYLEITINLSPNQFMRKNLVKEICKNRIENNIILEITERTIMKNPKLAIKTMNQLKESKFRISIDDFGTGYSSLSYLKNFPIDFLKIDKSFIDNITTNLKDQAIVAATINMAHGLGLLVTAEGVETKEQLMFLSKLKCDNAQGFLFSKPLPLEEFEKLLEENKRWKAA